MTRNQELTQEALSLNLSYQTVYDELSNIFPTQGEYIGSMANHFRGKLKNGTVEDLINAMDNYCLSKLIRHFKES